MNRRHWWLAVLAAAALALISTSAVLGYAGEVAGAVTVTPPTGTLKCGVPLTVSATIVDKDGKPIAGQSVVWTFASSPSGADTVNATPTTTDASGVATTTVTLACVAGSRTIRASADDVYASAVLGITAGGLPRTSTLSDSTPAGTPPIGTILAILAILAGAGIMARRLVLNPR